MVPIFQLHMIRERVLVEAGVRTLAKEQALSRRGPERLHSRVWECVRARGGVMTRAETAQPGRGLPLALDLKSETTPASS